MKKSIWFVFLAVFFLIPAGLWSQADWRKIDTIEDLWAAYPERVDAIFKNLNLDFPGLEKVKQSCADGDLRLASRHLLEYYALSDKTGSPGKEKVPGAPDNTSTADSVLQDVFSFQGVKGKVPRLADGHLKWDFTGPQYDMEWAWALNRHYPMAPLLTAYKATGNPEYVHYMDDFVKDWIISSWPYPGVKSSTALWRGLEVSFRVKCWKQVFFGFIRSDLISPATKLLILSSLPDHAHFARNFHARGNWLTMEMSGLATVAASWPEFKESPQWLNYTRETMVASMHDQVYPDGVQTELTSSYHHVALSNFSLYLNICREAGIELPAYFTRTIEAMWNYLAYSIRPDGFGILNNDADLADNLNGVLRAAVEFGREDWKYLATNGKTGTKPGGEPSAFFPWAGQLISRSGYGKNSHWSFFDIGPWGTGHQHNDKLNLTIVANGRDLLVDAGRFAYRGEIAAKFRGYATGSKGHNVIIPDDKVQAPGPALAEKPVEEEHYRICSDFDFASGDFSQFSNIEGIFTHSRSLFYVRGQYWIVVDRIQTDRPRKITALWHWHPGNRVVKEANGVVGSKNPWGNLKIIPAGAPEWGVELVMGREKPDIQGWYSPVYNSYLPNVTAVYSAEIAGNHTFAWLLLPYDKKVPHVKTEIVSINDDGLQVKIAGPGKLVRIISVPYTTSSKAEMTIAEK